LRGRRRLTLLRHQQTLSVNPLWMAPGEKESRKLEFCLMVQLRESRIDGQYAQRKESIDGHDYG
jgi:hypothetical protein